MLESLTALTPSNAPEIAGKLKTPEFKKLFQPEVKKPGVWNEEQKFINDKLGSLGKILPLHANPEARRTSYLTRTDILLMANGFLPPNTPEFFLAKQVMKELIVSERPDVVLWTLKGIYKEQYNEFANGSELNEAIRLGKITLPSDYHEKVDLLMQFDEYEAVGDASQPTRKQTPLVEIVATVGNKVREKNQVVEITPGKKDPLPKTKNVVPTLSGDASTSNARATLEKILNANVLTDEEKMAARRDYERIVQENMGVVSENSKRKEVPAPNDKITISEESVKDTLTHAKDPGYGRNRQFGLLGLTDAYFGGALRLFSDGSDTIITDQLKPISRKNLHERGQGILTLANNEAVRIRLRDLITTHLTLGYGYVRSDVFYDTSPSATQLMISDLINLAEDKNFTSGKQRMLFMNLPEIRTQILQMQEIVRSLKQSDGDFFDSLDKELDLFIKGRFLTEVDGLTKKTAENYQTQYREQVLSELTRERIDAKLLYPGVKVLQEKLLSAIKNAPSYYGTSEYYDDIVKALRKPDFTFKEKEKQEDLVRAREIMSGINAEYDPAGWQKTSLISSEKQERNPSLGDEILRQVSSNKKEFKALSHVLQSMAFIYDLSELYSAIPKDRLPKVPLWEPQKDGVLLKGAVNPYAVLRMVMAGGTSLSDMAENASWASPVHHRGRDWPPRKENDVERDFKRHKADLKKAFKEITPIDIEITAEKPVALIVGNNGSGKTFAMETAIQTLGMAERTGLELFAEEDKSSFSSVIRAMINASRHEQRISSFQQEADLMLSVIRDVEGKGNNSSAVWALDEIAKGTDSRDGLSILFAAIEWSRRNNVHLMVSTHYGKQFMELAEMLGMADYIKIYSPDASSHALKESEGIVSSNGVEVMEIMGNKNDIPKDLLAGLVENAKRIREVHDNRGVVKLKEIQVEQKKGIGSFAHEEDLADIGLSPSRQSSGQSGDFEIRSIHNGSWERPKILLGQDNQDLLGSPAESVKSGWKDYFIRKFADFSLTEQQLTDRKTHVKMFTTLARMNPQGFAAIKESLFNIALGKHIFEERVRHLDGAQRELERFNRDEEPLNKSLYLSRENGGDQFKLFKLLANEQGVGELKKSIKGLVDLLSQESTLEYAKQLQEKLQTIEQLGNSLIEESQLPSQEIHQRYGQAISKTLLKKVRSSLRSRGYGQEPLAPFLPQIGEAIGGNFQRPEDVFNFLSEKTQKGDISTLIKLSNWLEAQQISSTDYGHPLSSLKSNLNFFPEIRKTMKSRLTDPRMLEAARALFGNPEATPDEITDKVWGDFSNGNADLLHKFLSSKLLSTPGFSDSSSNELYKLANVTEMINLERWLKWQDKVNKISMSGNTTVITAEDKIGRAIYDSWKNAENVIQETQFLMTLASVINKKHMCEPSHSEDGTMDIKEGININLDAGLTDYVPQSIHVDGDTNIVTIGGMNGGGKSQTLITIADIMAWDHFVGFVPAKEAVLPKADFINCAINAGESIIGMSSFQNEITRYLKVLDKYVEAGCPRNGILFLDEPLAGTSSEDQTGIIVSIIDFLQSRGVKIFMTNHNHALYDVMRRTVSSDGQPIKFLPVAFGTEGNTKYKLEYFKMDETDQIKSRGIDVLEERGADKSFIEIARKVRQLIDQIEAAKKSTA